MNTILTAYERLEKLAKEHSETILKIITIVLQLVVILLIFLID